MERRWVRRERNGANLRVEYDTGTRGMYISATDSRGYAGMIYLSPAQQRAVGEYIAKAKAIRKRGLSPKRLTGREAVDE